MKDAKQYDSVIKIIHWTMAVLFLMMFVCAYTMINLSSGAVKGKLYDLHKATGLLLFGLFTLRLFWRCTHQPPKLSFSIPAWQRRAAKLNIIFLYVVMFLMPVSGFLTSTLGGHEISIYWIFRIAPLAHDKALSEFFSQTHLAISYIIIALLSIHILGALFHHYIQKEPILKRMLFNK